MSEYFTPHKTDADRRALVAARQLAGQFLTRDKTDKGSDREACTVTPISEAPGYAASIALLSADWSAEGAPGLHDYFDPAQTATPEESVTKIPVSISAKIEQPTSTPVEPTFNTIAANLGDLVGVSPTDPSGAPY